MKIYLNFKLRMQWYHFVLPVDSPKAVAWKWFNLLCVMGCYVNQHWGRLNMTSFNKYDKYHLS